MDDLNVKQLVMVIRQIAEEKNLPEDSVHSIIEQAIAAAWRRDYGAKEQEVRVNLNSNTGLVTVYASKEVADEVTDEQTQISVANAKKYNKDAKVGDIVEVDYHPTSFGRVAAQTAKQVILQRLREAEREVVLEEFEDKIGTVLVGTVQRVEPRFVRVEVGRANGILPQSEQIPGEYYSVGSRIKVFLKDVERGNRGPQLIFSRANEPFIEYLFRQEVPEMESGAVEIKAIAREAGKRTKVAVFSTVPGVDPVGTFVGGHGTRVQAVINEIGEQEKIDVVPYSDDVNQFITNALAPARLTSIKIDEANKKATVEVPEDQLSITIGRGGQNVRLASRLTGHEIDIVGESTTPKKEEAPRPKRKNVEDSLLSALNEAAEKDGSDS